MNRTVPGKTVPDSRVQSSIEEEAARTGKLPLDVLFQSLNAVRTTKRVIEPGSIDLTAEEKDEILTALLQQASVHHQAAVQAENHRTGSLNPHNATTEESTHRASLDVVMGLIDKIAPVDQGPLPADAVVPGEAATGAA